MKFESHGYTYSIDEYGVIHQENPQPYVYDQTYVSTYDTPEYQRNSDILQALRLGFVIGSLGYKPDSILDYGYGNGAFMKFIRPHIDKVYGYDVTCLPVDGCHIVKELRKVDVITFWDALEHVHDLSFVKDLDCKMIVISLPWCHEKGGDWFDTKYKHRKPNEHVHHFDIISLIRFMESIGWRDISDSHHEDIVRKSTHGRENILTMAFKR